MKTKLMIALLLVTGSFILMASQGRDEQGSNYHVVSSCGRNEGLSNLNRLVVNLMIDGWQPTGGIEINEGDYEICFYQAMVK